MKHLTELQKRMRSADADRHAQWLSAGRPVAINNKGHKLIINLDDCTTVAVYSNEKHPSDHTYYKEHIYKTPTGLFILHFVGGPASKYNVKSGKGDGIIWHGNSGFIAIPKYWINKRESIHND